MSPVKIFHHCHLSRVHPESVTKLNSDDFLLVEPLMLLQITKRIFCLAFLRAKLYFSKVKFRDNITEKGKRLKPLVQLVQNF